MTMANKLVIYYDAVCPSCQRDRVRYSRWVDNKDIEWCDINDNNRDGGNRELLAAGINPQQALASLHIKLPDGTIISDIDAYIELLKLNPWLRVIAWIIHFKIIKATLHTVYQKNVFSRLKKSNRLP